MISLAAIALVWMAMAFVSYMRGPAFLFVPAVVLTFAFTFGYLFS